MTQPYDPDSHRITTPIGDLTPQQFADYTDGLWRKHLIDVLKVDAVVVNGATRLELFELATQHARPQEPHEGDPDLPLDESADVPSGWLGRVGLYVDTADPELRTLTAGMLHFLARGPLADLLASADPFAVVQADGPELTSLPNSHHPHVMGMTITTADDDTLDRVADLLEAYGTTALRPVLDAAHPGRVSIEVQASDGLSIGV